MPDIRSVLIVTYTPVQDDAGMSGKFLGAIFGNYTPFPCTVDYSKLHDKMVPLVTYPDLPFHAPEMWVEWSHCVEGPGNKDKVQILTTYYFDGRVESKIVG